MYYPPKQFEEYAQPEEVPQIKVAAAAPPSPPGPNNQYCRGIPFLEPLRLSLEEIIRKMHCQKQNLEERAMKSFKHCQTMPKYPTFSIPFDLPKKDYALSAKQ